MRLLPVIDAMFPDTAALARRLRSTVVDDPNPVIVMWGGGKDSTLALILTKAVFEETNRRIIAVSMDNPGLSDETIGNIDRVTNRLQIEHQWWHFNRQIDGPRDASADWKNLYRGLARSLGDEPRFMCVGCNLGSVTVEAAAITANRAGVLVTGNPGWEAATFAVWMHEIAAEFAGVLSLPPDPPATALGYYQFWHTVYTALLRDVLGEAGDQYLYAYPQPGSTLSKLSTMSVLEDDSHACTAETHRWLLESVGWELPADIAGGTESDCRFTAAIAHLNIRRKGLPAHLIDVNEAHDHFQPYVQMRDRAIDWARSGRAADDGAKQLVEMGITEKSFGKRRSGIADALVKKLFKIR